MEQILTHIYRKNQDPYNVDGRMQLWAPDVTKGRDGRYYLYYCFSFYPEIGVAVSDSPAGPFEFSRQGCAEKITILPDGSIRQVEITSCGLNGGSLKMSGTYPSAIACHITSQTTMEQIDYNNPVKEIMICEDAWQVITQPCDIREEKTAIYFYFQGKGKADMKHLGFC